MYLIIGHFVYCNFAMINKSMIMMGYGKVLEESLYCGISSQLFDLVKSTLMTALEIFDPCIL